LITPVLLPETDVLPVSGLHFVYVCCAVSSVTVHCVMISVTHYGTVSI